MTSRFRKLMREQVQESLKNALVLAHKPIPSKGWIRTIRESLGIPPLALARSLGCSRTNIVAIERREAKGTISLQTLEQAAQAMNCKLVYYLVPLEPFDALLEKQARLLAKKRIKVINHSMQLEQQGLTTKQLKQQEDDLVEELLQGDPKKLWVDDEV